MGIVPLPFWNSTGGIGGNAQNESRLLPIAGRKHRQVEEPVGRLNGVADA